MQTQVPSPLSYELEGQVTEPVLVEIGFGWATTWEGAGLITVILEALFDELKLIIGVEVDEYTEETVDEVVFSEDFL